MLPDYVCGMLSDEERACVEEAVRHSPELQRELASIQAIVVQFPPERIRTEMEWRARNMSVAVHQRKTHAMFTVRRRHWAIAGALVAVCVALVVGSMFWGVLQQDDVPGTHHSRHFPALAEQQTVHRVEESKVSDSKTSPSAVAALKRLTQVPSRTVANSQNLYEPSELPAETLVYGTIYPVEMDTEFVAQVVHEFSEVYDE